MKSRILVISVFSLFFFISIYLVTVWFKDKNILATAEEGLPFYSPSRTYDLYKNLWVNQGLGFVTPFFLPRITLYGISGFLYNLGISSWIIQSFVFFTLIFTSLSGTFLLFRYLVSGSKIIYSFIASLFYVFNLFTLSQVFVRFIYPLMFLWALLPLFIFFWVRFIDSNKYRYLFLLVIFSLFYSDSFGLTASVFSLWIPAFIYSAYMFVTAPNKAKVLVSTILGVLIWGVLNLWWIFPVIQTGKSSYSDILSSNQNLDSLFGVSVYFPSNEILQLKQKYWFGSDMNWNGVYENDWIQLTIVGFLFVTILGLISSRKEKKWWYIFSLFIIGWFVSKGANTPFGVEFYSFIYKYLPITQVLRNPYEKFGAVFLLSYSLFFALGIKNLGSIFTSNSKFLNILVILLILLSTKPLWNGEALKNYAVEVPPYYNDADLYLNSLSEARLLQLPLLRGSTLTYRWGYTGEEPSEFLFSRPSVSKSYVLNEFEDFYLTLQANKYFRDNKNFTNILYLMNIEEVVLHKDIIHSSYIQESVDESRKVILGWKDVKFVNSIGELEIYSLNKNKSLGRIYVGGNLIKVNGMEQILDQLVSDSYRLGYDVVAEYNDHYADLDDVSIPEISYLKISPSEYRVRINNSTNTYILILADNYNQLWFASSDNKVFEKHFEVNGFANGWLIDKKGDYTIDIQFKIWPWQ